MTRIMARIRACYGDYYEMTTVAAMIAVMGKRSDNNNDGHGRAE